MDKYLNLLLELPATINQNLPRNNFNEVMDGSEKSVKGWVGLVYKVFALVFLVSMLYAVLQTGLDHLNGGASSISKVGSVLAILLYVYASFPLAQIIRNAGDSLVSSKSGIIDFVFKDIVVVNIRAVGFITALGAFFTAVVMTISFVLNADVFGFSYGVANELGNIVSFPLEILGMFLAMISLGDLSDLFNQLYSLEFMGGTMASAVDGWTWDGLSSVALSYVSVLVVLIQLFISLAVYHFLYALVTTFVKWIKGPYLPFKSL
ncbi:MAG: hypothetical protein P8H63_00970 [Flavobacteriaceae bacterium]|nr:hypothetical protein [Flavobacteriaceae bacterium]